MDLLKVTVNAGKYTVVQSDSGRVSALRYDEPWRDCVGDNLILSLAQELDEAREAMAIFCYRVEIGEVQSKKTYEQFKTLLHKTEHERK